MARILSRTWRAVVATTFKDNMNSTTNTAQEQNNSLGQSRENVLFSKGHVLQHVGFFLPPKPLKEVTSKWVHPPRPKNNSQASGEMFISSKILRLQAGKLEMDTGSTFGTLFSHIINHIINHIIHINRYLPLINHD
jgi:hypothetical protein